LPTQFRIYVNLEQTEFDQLERRADSMQKSRSNYVKDLITASWKTGVSEELNLLRREFNSRLESSHDRLAQILFLLRKLIHDSSVNHFRIESVLQSLPVQEQVEMRSEMAAFVERRIQRYEDALSHLTGGENAD
jgi:hypothetical protein